MGDMAEPSAGPARWKSKGKGEEQAPRTGGRQGEGGSRGRGAPGGGGRGVTQGGRATGASGGPGAGSSGHELGCARVSVGGRSQDDHSAALTLRVWGLGTSKLRAGQEELCSGAQRRRRLVESYGKKLGESASQGRGCLPGVPRWHWTLPQPLPGGCALAGSPGS